MHGRSLEIYPQAGTTATGTPLLSCSEAGLIEVGIATTGRARGRAFRAPLYGPPNSVTVRRYPSGTPISKHLPSMITPLNPASWRTLSRHEVSWNSPL